MATIHWYGDQIGARLNRSARSAVRHAGSLLTTRARLIANIPAKRIRSRRTRATAGGKAGSQYTRFVPSKPGQPPALRTGFGRRNIDMEVRDNGLKVRIGVRTAAKYMSYLEVGTKRVRPRPWLRPAFDQTRAAIEVILKAGLRGG